MKRELFLFFAFAVAITSCGGKNISSDSKQQSQIKSSQPIGVKTHEVTITMDNFDEYFSVIPGNTTDTYSGGSYFVTVKPTIRSYRHGFVYYEGTVSASGNVNKKTAQGTYPQTYVEKDYPYSFTASFNKDGIIDYEKKWEGKLSETPYKYDYNDTITHTFEVVGCKLKAIYIHSGISGIDLPTYSTYQITKYNFNYYFSISSSSTNGYSVKPIDSTDMYDYDIEVTYNGGNKIKLHRDGTYNFGQLDSLSIEGAVGTIDVYPGRII